MATVLQDPAIVTGAYGVDAKISVWRPLAEMRTWAAIAIWLVGTDLAIYRGGGWSGWGVAFALVPIMIAIGPRKQSLHWPSWLIVCALVGLLAIKLVWCGATEAVLAMGFVALAAVLSGQGVVPYVGRLFVAPLLMAIGLLSAFIDSLAIGRDESPSADRNTRRPRISGQVSLGVALPLLATIVFGAIFVLANPNFRTWIDVQWRWVSSTLVKWLENLDAREFLFWLFSAAIGLAFLFPYVADWLQKLAPGPPVEDPQAASRAAYFYPAARNTLSALVMLFGIYLGYEFYSMWFREFPTGFYYAGYAHEGAFWLTVALALAVFTLSTIFCNTMQRDSRIERLKWLAWLWSAENLLLAAAVYNRLLIYIDFNGLTRMRVVGLLGVSAVVVGFCLVVYKIAQQRGFQWLIQRQLWALSLSLIVYAVLPVDWLVHRHNASQVLAGDLAPSVQMIAHNTRADGMLQVLRLIDCEDVEIREGVRAMAAQWSDAFENNRQPPNRWSRHLPPDGLSPPNRSPRNWSHYQIADDLLRRKLNSQAEKLAAYTDNDSRKQRLQRFYDYAYRWY